MYCVIHARKVVLLMIVLALIGITFWAGFYGTDEAVDVGAGCWDEEFAGFISQFLERSSPLVRIRRAMRE